MAKVIRTARIAGPVVTLGDAERELYLREDQPDEGDSLDLGEIVEARVNAMRDELESRAAERLQHERQLLQQAADQALEEARTQAERERQQVHEQRYEEGYQAGLEAREAEAREAVETH